jgi:hypothetical protein
MFLFVIGALSVILSILLIASNLRSTSASYTVPFDKRG